MELKTNAVVLGMKKFKGTVDGNNYDSTTIYVEEPLGQGENARGTAAIEYKAGDSTVFDSMRAHSFPLQCELTIEITATGKGGNFGQKTTVKAVKPLQPSKPGQPIPPQAKAA